MPGHGGFIQPGNTVLYGPRDSLFEICNNTGETVQIALIYQHYWRAGEPPTWPAKGWFIYRPNDCSTVAVNGLFGVMSVMWENDRGDLVPYYNGDRRLDDVTVTNSEAKLFATEHLCLGAAPFDQYRDNFSDYFECREGETEVPFSIIFKQGGKESFTLTLS